MNDDATMNENTPLKYQGMTREDARVEALKDKEIKMLESSIERREKLLANENYVNKAPANIVEMDKQKLLEEKNKLKELLNNK